MAGRHNQVKLNRLILRNQVKTGEGMAKTLLTKTVNPRQIIV